MIFPASAVPMASADIRLKTNGKWANNTERNIEAAFAYKKMPNRMEVFAASPR
jgi:hypothetical protein